MRRLLGLLLILPLLAADAPNVATIDPAAPDLAAEWQAKLATLPDGGTLRIPDAPLTYAAHTIWQGTDRITIEGPGSDSRRAVLVGLTGVTPLVFLRPDFSWRRDEPDLAAANPDGTFKLGSSFAADHRFDLYGLADASLAPTPNCRWGVATRTPSGGNARPDAQIWWWDAPPATADGDGWAGIDALTFTILLQGPVRGKYVVGLGSDDNPSPWFLTAEADGFHLSFRADGDLDASPWPRVTRFGDPTAAGRLLLTFQVDLRTGVIRAWQDLRETPAQSLRWATPADLAGKSFALNKQCPFTVGAWGYSLQGGDQAVLGDRGDLKVAGFCAHKAPLYTSDADGNQQFAGAFAGTPANDLHMLDGIDQAGSFLFSLDNQYSPPQAGPLGREVYCWTAAKLGRYRSEGFFLPFAQDVTNPALEYVRMRGLTVQGSGAAVTLGQTLVARFDDVVFRGANVGLSFLPGCSTYKVWLDHCGVSGANAGVKADSAILSLRAMAMLDVGRVGISARGCTTVIDDWAAGGMAPAMGGTHDALVEMLDGGYGSSLAASHLWNDAEGPPGFARGLVYAERHNTALTKLALSDLDSGGLAPGAPLVRLVDRYGSTRPGVAACSIRGCFNSSGGPLVAAEGAWKVDDGPAPAPASAPPANLSGQSATIIFK